MLEKDNAWLESKRPILLDAEAIQLEDGQWHLTAEGMDVRVSCRDRYSGFKIEGVIGDYVFVVTGNGLLSDQWFCYDKYIPEKILHYKTKKVGSKFEVNIVTPSHMVKSTEAVTGHYGDEEWDTGDRVEVNREYGLKPIKTMEINWPIPKLEPFERIVQTGYATTIDGRRSRSPVQCVKLANADGTKETVLTYSRYGYWIPDSRQITIEPSKWDTISLDRKTLLGVLSDQMGQEVIDPLASSKDKALAKVEQAPITERQEIKRDFWVGKVTRWFSEKGFGFLRTNKPLTDGKNEIFIHKSNLCSHASESIDIGKQLYVSPEKGEKGWSVAKGTKVLCSECEVKNEQILMNSRAAGIIKKYFDEQYYIADGCNKTTICRSEAEVIANALESAASYWKAIPVMDEVLRLKYGEALVSGNEALIAELQGKLSDFKQAQQLIKQNEADARAIESRRLFSEGIRLQEEHINNPKWAEQKAKLIRETILGAEGDLTSFSLEISYVLTVYGIVYGIVAEKGSRDDSYIVERVNMEDYFRAEPFYAENRYKLPYNHDNVFRCIVRKETAVAARAAIAEHLKDIFKLQKQQIDNIHAEALIFNNAVTKLAEAREKLQDVQNRARSYRIELATELNYQLSNINKDSLDEVLKSINLIEDYVVLAEAEIKARLDERGQKEIATKLKGEEAEREFQKAMNAEAAPATWFLRWIDVKKVEAMTGRKFGEGLGDIVAGRGVYLPGSRALVGMSFGGRSNRYNTTMESFGLVPMSGYSIPKSAGKGGAELIALVEDPSWKILSTNFHDGLPTDYMFANADGITYLTDGGNSYKQERWDGIEWQNEAHVALAREAHKFNEGTGDPEIDEARQLLQVSTTKAKLIRDFVVAAVGAVGAKQAVALIYKEEGEAYGRGRRTDALQESLPGVDLTRLDWGQGMDIRKSLQWAEHKFGKFSDSSVGMAASKPATQSYEVRSDKTVAVAPSFAASAFADKLKAKLAVGKAEKSVVTAPIVRPVAKPTEKEKMTEDLRASFMGDLTNSRLLIDLIRAVPEPDKKAPNADKVSKLRIRAGELKRDLAEIEQELSATDDADRARGKVTDIVKKVERITVEIARLQNIREDWPDKYKTFMARLVAVAKLQNQALDVATLDKIRPKVAELAKHKGEVADLDGELELIVVDSI